MKIGLITMHNVCNYGAVLQTYALMKKIEEINGSCQIIDYVPSTRKGLRIYFPREELPFFRKVLSWIKWLPVRIGWQKTFNEFMTKYYVNLSSTIYEGDEFLLTDCYDAVITGSDQVWNSSSTRGIDNIYFLKFAGSRTKKISYAASISAINYNNNDHLKIKNLLRDFDAISIREKTLINEIQHLSEKLVLQTIDPTVLVGRQFWIDFTKNIKNPIKGNYALMYILGESKNSIKSCKKYCKDNNLKSVKISFTNKKEADIVLKNPSPETFVKLFLEADYIVTNSLHGCLFSVIFGKKFSIPESIADGTRFSNFIDTYNLRKYSKTDTTDKIIQFQPNYLEIDGLIEKLRTESFQFLFESIKD